VLFTERLVTAVAPLPLCGVSRRHDFLPAVDWLCLFDDCRCSSLGEKKHFADMGNLLPRVAGVVVLKVALESNQKPENGVSMALFRVSTKLKRGL